MKLHVLAGSALLTIAAAASLAFATMDMITQLRSPVAGTGAGRMDADGSLLLRADLSAPEATWPDVFGRPETSADPAPAIVAPVSTEFRLVGLVSGPSGSWAMVQLPSGEGLWRVGDRPEPGTEVAAIDAEGVLIRRPGGFERIAFEQPPPSGQNDAPEDPAASQVAELPVVATQSGGGVLPAARISIPIVNLGQRELERYFARAGQTRLVRDGDVTALELVWAREGEFFDRIGLLDGDRIVRINSADVGSIKALRDLAPEVARTGILQLDLLRAGNRQHIQVQFAAG